MIYENLSNHQTHSRNPGKNNEILKWRKCLSSNVNTTHQSLNTDKEKKDCLLLFPLASYLQELLQPWMFLCLCVPRRLRLPCEEPGSVHGSPLAAVLHCVVEAASLNRVYLREGGRREWEERCSWQQQHFDSQLKSVVCHCQVEQPGVAPRLAFVLSATLIWYFFAGETADL